MTYVQFVATIGIVAIVTILVEVIKRAAQWTSDATQRFAPLLAVTLGAILSALLFLVAPPEARVGQDILIAILFGLVQGAGAVGLYDVGGRTVIEKLAGEHNPPGNGPATPPTS